MSDQAGGGSSSCTSNPTLPPSTPPPSNSKSCAEPAPAPSTLYPFRCTTHKESQIKDFIQAYTKQLTVGCGVSTCTHKKCASSASFEYASISSDKGALFAEAVNLARRAFRKDSCVNAYFFCENVAHPLHCFRLDVLTDDKIAQANTNEEMLEVLRKGLASDTETLLHAFPLFTPEQYAAEAQLVSKTSSSHRLGLDLMSVHKSMTRVHQLVTDTEALTPILSVAVNKITMFMLGPTGNGGPTAAITSKSPVQYGPTLVLGGKELAARAALVLLQLGALFDPTYGNSQLLHELCHAIQRTENTHDAIAARLSFIPRDQFRDLVVSMQQYISVQLYQNAVFINETIASATAVLALLYKANYLHDNVADGIVGYEEFYNGAVNDIIDMKKDFVLYVKTRNSPAALRTTFTFAQHPFMLDLHYKSLLLNFHSRVEQEQEVQNTLQSLMASHWLSGGGGGTPNLTQDDFSFKLVVDRHDLVPSALTELASKSDNRGAYKKPLRVHFRGEDGVDEGGVRKEFFQLIVKQVFDPSYGMFQVMQGSNVQWFLPDIMCTKNDSEFRLIGLLFGLAIYNSVILDIQFPSVVYKKLLGHEEYLSLKDLAAVDPELARGLGALLEFEEDPEKDLTVENVFCRTMSIDYDVGDTSVIVDLVDGGRDIPLTAKNRQEYVDRYVKHYLNESVAGNFGKFQKAFLDVCDNPVLKQIRPAELEFLVVGSPVMDFTLLKNVCRYDGYKKSDPTIVHFWEIVLHEMDEEQQKKLLKFCTGSDRVPVGGLGNMTFVVGKNGGESDLLPTSHTCFNHLLLPDYGSKEKLKEKLLMAIHNCTGFGLM
eukprot:PhM_4_TR13303/c0_g1_i1/m.76953/K10587/UBE3A, E6AP; ubiquitin-protein ligase E3 A